MGNHFDIAVIGGGASGLFFTALAAKIHKDYKFVIIEKNPRVGKKLSVTGNGRCNLTNIYSCADNYHGTFSFNTRKSPDICSPQVILDCFKKMGLITRTDEAGRVYPKSNQASTVLDVLRFNCTKPNVDIMCDTNVSGVNKNRNSFDITTNNGTINADKVVFACGGAASPKAGGDKSGYSILRSLGHQCVKLSPALCPVNVKSDYLKTLKGIRATGEVTLLENNKSVKSEEGEIQFTEKSLSGICVFNLSQYIEPNKKYTLRIKLLNEYNFNEILELLKNNQTIYKMSEAENLMTGIFQKRIAQVLLKISGIPINKPVSQLTDKELKTLAQNINAFDFEVSGIGDFNVAQITKGGINGKEINPETMESKIIENLYLLGEVIDCNGDCGGFNLQFAFATGYMAANSI